MAPRRNIRNQRNANRSSRRQPLSNLMLDTRRSNGPHDPPPVSTSMRLTKVVPIQLALTSGAGTITWASIVAETPASVTGVYNMRLQKISFWSSGATTTTGTATPQRIQVTDNTTDQMSLIDVAVPGQALAQVHITPSLSLRQTWVSSSNTTALYNVAATDSAITVHATVEFNLL